MAIKQAQSDRGTAMSILQNLGGLVANFKIFFKELEDFKDEVVADLPRKAELEAYFDNCECAMSWAEVVSKYQEYKAIYEAIIGE